MLAAQLAVEERLLRLVGPRLTRSELGGDVGQPLLELVELAKHGLAGFAGERGRRPRGRPLDRVRRWETFVAGFAAGVAFLILVIGVAGGLTIPGLSMWGNTMLLGAGIFGTATGALTLAFAEVARRGGGAVTAGVGDPAALPPA